MRSIASAIIVFALLLVAGCASQSEKPDANYAAYLQLIDKQQAEAEQQRAAFAQMAQKCTSDACVSQVAAIAALAGANGQANHSAPQQYVPHESTAARFGLAFISQLSPLAAAAVNWHSTSVNRDISLAQYSFLGGTVHDLATASTSLGQYASTMTPSINVGGDYITGSVDNGTHVGRDYITGSVDNGTHVGRDLISGTQDNGVHIGGDYTGGNKIDNSGLFNDGTLDRYESGGPYDDHSAAGSGCTGTTCQITPPESTP